MKAIIILSLLVLSCLASHHLRRHHKELTPAQIAKIIKGLSGHGGSSGSGSGSGSNEEFDFEGDQLAAKKGLSVKQILKLIQEGIAAGKDVTALLKQLKEDKASNSGSGSSSGSNEEFDFEGDQLAAKKGLSVEEILQLIQEGIAAGKDVTALMKLLKQHGGSTSGSGSGSGSGSNEEFDFEAEQFAANNQTNQTNQSKEDKIEKDIQEALLAGKDVTGLLQLLKQIKSLGGNGGSNSGSGSGSNEELDFEADEFAAKKQTKESKEDKIEKDIQEALLAGKDVTGLMQLLKQIKSLGGKSGSSSGSGSGSNEEFDFEADQFSKKHQEPTRIISVIH